MAGKRTIGEARDILLDFAARTGLDNGAVAARRYLWTDAHAVCTYLSLFRATGDKEYRRLALALVEQVHAVLGRHRHDDPRQGWISGLVDEEARRHPTVGGLRIGKQLKERQRGEPLDERLEWERDGQYFHYLTKWMHALCRTASTTGDDRYRRWAAELATAAYKGFVVAAPDGRRLYWKMSIDLKYPLVTSSGHHDPLDGYITFSEIAGQDSTLDRERHGLGEMIEGGKWATTDPLGIGGLLFDAARVIQLTAAGRLDGMRLASILVTAAGASLTAWMRNASLDRPADERLAFRELGLTIGLHAVEVMNDVAAGQADRFGENLRNDLAGLCRYLPIAEAIEDFWRDTVNQQARSWLDHADINAVTLATSLLPDEFIAV